MGMMGAVCSGERESSREQPARAEGLEMEMELFSQLERINPALERGYQAEPDLQAEQMKPLLFVPELDCRVSEGERSHSTAK